VWPDKLVLEGDISSLWLVSTEDTEWREKIGYGEYSFITDSSYLKALQLLLKNDSQNAKQFLLSANTRDGNMLAAALIAATLIRNSTSMEDARISLSAIEQEMREPAAIYLLSLAGRCHVAGDLDQAMVYLELGLSLLTEEQQDGLGVELSRRIGEIYYYNNQIELAEPWLWQAAPAGYSPLILLSRIFSQQKRFQESIPIYDRALTYYPENIELITGIAYAYRELGDLAKARQILEGTKPQISLGVKGFLLLAQICNSLGDYQCAREGFSMVLKIDEDNEEAMAGLNELPQ
jgi:tetratricopeptide (TPR) repeat protein